LKNVSFVFLFITAQLLVLSGCGSTESSRRATMQSRWEEALAQNTISAYWSFAHDYPEGEYARIANEKIDWMTATGTAGSIGAFESFAKTYPSSVHAPEADSIVEQWHFQMAHKYRVHASIEEYLKRYPSGVHADRVRKLREERLFELATLMWAPSMTLRDGHYYPVFLYSDDHEAELWEFRALLRAGADPNRFRIKGFEPPCMRPLNNGTSFTYFGAPGKACYPEEGGMTLQEYLQKTEQSEALSALESILHGTLSKSPLAVAKPTLTELRAFVEAQVAEVKATGKVPYPVLDVVAIPGRIPEASLIFRDNGRLVAMDNQGKSIETPAIVKEHADSLFAYVSVTDRDNILVLTSALLACDPKTFRMTIFRSFAWRVQQLRDSVSNIVLMTFQELPTYLYPQLSAGHELKDVFTVKTFKSDHTP
jgi:hypothetical protein